MLYIVYIINIRPAQRKKSKIQENLGKFMIFLILSRKIQGYFGKLQRSREIQGCGNPVDQLKLIQNLKENQPKFFKNSQNSLSVLQACLNFSFLYIIVKFRASKVYLLLWSNMFRSITKHLLKYLFLDFQLIYFNFSN